VDDDARVGPAAADDVGFAGDEDVAGGVVGPAGGADGGCLVGDVVGDVLACTVGATRGAAFSPLPCHDRAT
jgi:hypothetical protein